MAEVAGSREPDDVTGQPGDERPGVDRALDEEEILAACVLPDRLCLLFDSWPGREAMASLLCQTARYAEICGAPETGVWPRGFWYRPLATAGEVKRRAAAIARLPSEEDLVARFGHWPAGFSALPAASA